MWGIILEELTKFQHRQLIGIMFLTDLVIGYSLQLLPNTSKTQSLCFLVERINVATELKRLWFFPLTPCSLNSFLMFCLHARTDSKQLKRHSCNQFENPKQLQYAKKRIDWKPTYLRIWSIIWKAWICFWLTTKKFKIFALLDTSKMISLWY